MPCTVIVVYSNDNDNVVNAHDLYSTRPRNKPAKGIARNNKSTLLSHLILCLLVQNVQRWKKNEEESETGYLRILNNVATYVFTFYIYAPYFAPMRVTISFSFSSRDIHIRLIKLACNIDRLADEMKITKILRKAEGKKIACSHRWRRVIDHGTSWNIQKPFSLVKPPHVH